MSVRVRVCAVESHIYTCSPDVSPLTPESQIHLLTRCLYTPAYRTSRRSCVPLSCTRASPRRPAKAAAPSSSPQFPAMPS